MIDKTVYTNGQNHYECGIFDSEEWNAPYMVNVSEIAERLHSFNLVGRKIKEIRFIGLCYNLRRDEIEDSVYIALSGTDDIRQHQSEYQNIPDTFRFERTVDIDEPLLIMFEDEHKGLGDIFSIVTAQKPEFRMGMNSIPWCIRAGTNLPNMSANVLLAPCIGQTVTGVEISTYRAQRDPITGEIFDDGSEKELVSNIIIRLENNTGIKIEGWIDSCFVSCIGADNKILTISFEELKKGLFNPEDIYSHAE